MGEGEYTSSVFQKDLADNGIKQEFSCPNTPQQNGVSERKHRHIRGTALTLMYASGIPKSFFDRGFSHCCVHNQKIAFLKHLRHISLLVGKAY